jgi:hypothetical protein
MQDTEYMGRNGFFWFHGVVEDRTDPDKLGRLRVRILGCHTKDKSLIQSEELQWAYVVQPITSAAMSGLGSTPLGPVPGTWVFGFFRDGDSMQEPCILGTMGGIPQVGAEPTQGFSDPRDNETEEKLSSAPRKIKERDYPTDGTGAKLTPEAQAQSYPRTTHPNGCIVGESDVNRIARGENVQDTIIQIMRDLLDKGVPISFGGSWDEKPIWYEGKYPFVHVTESESGHIHVTDDTPGHEGTLDWDRSGTFTETLSDGSKVQKIVKDGYTIILGKNFVHIMNDVNERYDQEYNLSVGGRWNVEVAGNINLLCHNNVYAKVEGDLNVASGGDANVSVGGDTNIKSLGDINVQTNENLHVTGNEVSVKSSGKVSIESSESIHIKAGGDFAVDASSIWLNSGKSSPNDPKKPITALEPKQ